MYNRYKNAIGRIRNNKRANILTYTIVCVNLLLIINGS